MKNAWTLFIIQPYSKSRDGILPLLCLYRWDCFYPKGISGKQKPLKHKILQIIDPTGLL